MSDLDPSRFSSDSSSEIKIGLGARALVIALVSLGIASADTASAVASASKEQKSASPAPESKSDARRPDPATVAKLLQQSQSAPVPVIIEFEISGVKGTAYRPEAGLSGAQAAAQQQAIQQMGDSVLASFDTVLAVYTGPGIRRLTEVASNDDGPGTGNQSLVRFNARAGVLYRIAVDGFEGAEGDITLIHASLRGLRPSLVASSQVTSARRPEHLWETIARYADLD